ncbi:MAG: helix-turn-helix domain-containing protein [Allorhizobium sp.]
MARPEIKPKTALGSRLRAVRERLRYEEREEFAAKLGISKSALAYYERGERVPDASTLAAYHEQFGVDVTWIVTGSGEMFNDPSKAPVSAYDAELVELLFDRAGAVFADAGQHPPPRRLAREAINLHRALARMVPDLSDTEMVRAALPAAELDLRRRLDQAAAEPGGGKRSA